MNVVLMNLDFISLSSFIETMKKNNAIDQEN